VVGFISGVFSCRAEVRYFFESLCCSSLIIWVESGICLTDSDLISGDDSVLTATLGSFCGGIDDAVLNR